MIDRADWTASIAPNGEVTINFAAVVRARYFKVHCKFERNSYLGLPQNPVATFILERILKQGVLTSDSAMPQAGKSVMIYDNLGRQTSVTLYKYERNADGAVTSTSKTSTNEYDRNGNLIKTSAPVLAQDGIGQGTFEKSMTYDAASRLIRENATNLTSTYAGYNYTSNYYYGGGRTVTETHTTRGTSETTAYTYDAGARMKTINGGGQTFTFQYYPNGSRKKVIYGNSFMTADYQYDRSYRLLSLNYNWGSANLGFTYAYREDGKIVSATESGSGGNVPVDCLEFVGADDESTKLPGNHPTINSNILYGGLRTTNYTYNDLGQLVNAVTPRYCNAVPEKSFTWGYDSMGNKISESWQEGSYQYLYVDPEEGTRSVKTVYYTNKGMTHTYQNDGRNQIQSSSGMQTKRDNTFDYTTDYTEQYTYDRMGNLVKHVTEVDDDWEPTNSTKTTVTTEFNEIWKVAQQTTEIGYTRDSAVNYFYDISGNMLRESDDAHQDQYYYYGSNGLTCIYDSKLGVKHSYIRAGLQLLSSSDGFYYIVNGRGDVVALVSNRAATYYNSGDIIGYYVYEPFGGLRAAQKQRTVFNKFKFAGGLQSNTGNYAFGSRIYAPGQGRWISMDAYQGSVNDPLSLNRYAYCNNDPVNFVDPSGYFAWVVPMVWNAATLSGAALINWVNANLPTITQYLYLFGDKIAGIVHDLFNSNSSSAGSPGDPGDPGNKKPKVIQTGGHTLKSEAIKILGLTKDQANKAFEAMKKYYHIPPDYHGKILENGDYINPNTGELLGNIYDFVK